MVDDSLQPEHPRRAQGQRGALDWNGLRERVGPSAARLIDELETRCEPERESESELVGALNVRLAELREAFDRARSLEQRVGAAPPRGAPRAARSATSSAKQRRAETPASMARGGGAPWWIERIELEDVLGYRGRAQFAFELGLNVVEAPNHSGKTSLALATLWALTGAVPKLARVNRTSFRLTNRHAGTQAEPRVRLELASSPAEVGSGDPGSGDPARRMTLERRYVPRSKPEDGLVLEVDGETLDGAAAAARLASELGLAGSSLEGVGVVLQDQRHALVAGGEGDLSGVLNDVLGLDVLAAVVPVLAQARGDATRLHREAASFLEGDDPLRRWELEQERLIAAFAQAERNAGAAGFDAHALEDVETSLAAELSALAEELGRGDELEGGDARRALEDLREDLRAQRSASPLSRRAEQRAVRTRAAEQAERRLGAAQARLAELEREASVHERARAAARALAERAKAELAACAARRRALEDEKRLVQVAYQHAHEHPDEEQCPVCERELERGALVSALRLRLDERLVVELEALGEREAEARARQAEARELEAGRATWERELERFGLELAAWLADPRWFALETDGDPDRERTAERDACAALATVLADGDLASDAALRARTASALAALVERTATDATAARAAEEHARQLWQRQEAEVFQPLERRLERVREHLVPLADAGIALEAHASSRATTEARAGELERVVADAEALARDLDQIARAVAELEREHAAAAVARCEPRLSGCFARVAGNPDYTGLTIAAEIVRGKVAYRLRASSRTSPDLDDAAGHVLSEGDLSAAAVALLVALAVAGTNAVGFLLLDDPAQGMDERLRAALAVELTRFDARPQTIVLTHQRDFADALTAAGGARQRLADWSGGRARLVVDAPPAQG